MDALLERRDNVEAIIWAQEHPNQIMHLANSAVDATEAKHELIDRYGFSMEQASAIIDMRTRVFCKDMKKRIYEELLELEEKISQKGY